MDGDAFNFIPLFVKYHKKGLTTKVKQITILMNPDFFCVLS